MKKILYILALVGITLTACHINPSYTISGTVGKEVKDGQKVFLLNSCNIPYKKADSAVVKDGKFSFTGQLGTPQICILQIPTSNIDEKIIPFILENGHIIINAEKDIVAGTITNNTFQAHKDSIKSYEKEFLESLKKLQNDSSLTAHQKELKKEMEIRKRVKKEMSLFRNAIEIDSVNINANNPISTIYMQILTMDSIQKNRKP